MFWMTSAGRVISVGVLLLFAIMHHPLIPYALLSGPDRCDSDVCKGTQRLVRLTRRLHSDGPKSQLSPTKVKQLFVGRGKLPRWRLL